MGLLPQPHCPWISIPVLFPPLHVGRPWGLLLSLPWGAWIAPVRARCGGGAAAWVTGVLAAPGTQGGWRLGQQETQCSRRYGSQYWPLRSSVLAWRTPDREAWQATVYRVTKSQTRLKTLHVEMQDFFPCGSSASVRTGREGGAAARLAGTLAAPSVQGLRLPLQQEFSSDQSLFLIGYGDGYTYV